MGKKPEDQTSNLGVGDADNDEDLDLGTDADGDGGDGAGDGDDEDEDESGAGSGAGGESPDLEKLLDGFGDKLMTRVSSEIDRRINGAFNKKAKAKPDADKDDEDEDDKGKGGSKRVAPLADVRTARLAYREAVPESIKFLSTEEREFGNEYGRLLIAQAAVDGMDDPDAIGEDVAKKVAEKLTSLRKYYSGRTKSLLQKQGALVPQKSGQQTGGAGAVGDKTKGAELAMKMRERMTPTVQTNK